MQQPADKLASAMRKRTFIRFSNRFETSVIRGYVLDIGPQFFLLALVSDRIWFDGFECFRIEDISNLKPDPYAAFAEAALKKRADALPDKPSVDLSGIAKLLLSASRAFPLVTISREQVDPDVCFIGRVQSATRGRLSLLKINPDATWDKSPRDYALDEITRVNFAGDYENALHLVGGNPPSRRQRSKRSV